MSNLTAAKNSFAAKKPPKGKQLSLTITITGRSAERLFAVGPVDIRDHFLTAGFGTGDFSPADVKSVKFTVPGSVTYNRRVKKGVHRENF